MLCQFGNGGRRITRKKKTHPAKRERGTPRGGCRYIAPCYVYIINNDISDCSNGQLSVAPSKYGAPGNCLPCLPHCYASGYVPRFGGHGSIRIRYNRKKKHLQCSVSFHLFWTDSSANKNKFHLDVKILYIISLLYISNKSKNLSIYL